MKLKKNTAIVLNVFLASILFENIKYNMASYIEP